jgi:hypothetical protein
MKDQKIFENLEVPKKNGNYRLNIDRNGAERQAKKRE